MSNPFVRFVKYFLAWCVVCVVVLVIDYQIKSDLLSAKEYFQLLLSASQGLKLLAAILFLAFYYTKFGVVERTVEGSLTADREQVINALFVEGFSPREERDGEIVFRADNLLKRALMLWEDWVKVSQQDGQIRFQGSRRVVVRARYRLEGYLQMKRRHEE